MVKLKELHEFAVREGIEVDPRNEEEIEDELNKRKEKYEKLEGIRKEKYDKERLKNPFDDSKILYGENMEVEKLAIGVDIETQDLLLIDKLNEKGYEIDGAITHHPEGRGLARLYKVMKLQIRTLEEVGVPVSQAEAIVKGRVKEVMKSLHGGNHSRAPRTAELLDIPYSSMHTVSDNHAHNFLKKYLHEKNPYRISDLIENLLEIPEYEWSLEHDMGPQIFNGSEKNRVGKLAYDMTGGTEMSKDRLEKMAQSGVNTIVAMHMSKDQIKEAGDQNINVVAAGHMPSDSLGINLLFDKIIEEFNIELFEISGFKRISRI